MEYRAICGSRSYGIETEASDYDIVLSSATDAALPCERAHNIKLTEERFLRRLLLLENNAYYMQICFPKEILDDSDTAKYIMENRESIVRANLDRIYSAYIGKADGLSWHLEDLWERYPKRAVYSCLFYDTVHRFATQDISFAEAFRPEEDLRQWLLAVRRREIPKEEILNRNTELRKKAESVAGFYSGVEDGAALQRAVCYLNGLLGTNITYGEGSG